MSDRLNELRRQRALVQEHLAWLEREITATEKSAGLAASLGTPTTSAERSPPSSLPTPAPVATPSPRTFSLTRETELHTAKPGATEALFDQYRIEPSNLKSDVRKGCFLYFALAFVLLGLGVGALWFAFRR